MSLTAHEFRLNSIERNASDLAKSVTALSEEVGREAQWRREQELIQAREDERDKRLYERLDEMQTEIEAVRSESRAGIKEIKGVWVKLQWIVISAVIGSLVVLMFGRFG